MREQVVDLLGPAVGGVSGWRRQLHVVARGILSQFGPVRLHGGRIAAHG